MEAGYLVLLADEGPRAGVSALARSAGISAVAAAEWDEGAVAGENLAASAGIVFDRLGVAAVRADLEQATALRRAAVRDTPILTVEAERTVHALEAEPAPGEHGEIDESIATWGLQATTVTRSRFTGRGVGVAVLDTGLDLDHPDFAGRAVAARSFVLGESALDRHGHGTHCAGTACGPAHPARLPRYGVAVEAGLRVGKVLDDDGSGVDRSILAGINWAVTGRCAVISLSVGARVRPGEPYSAVFEEAARRATRQGTLIVAAAGNDSRREAGLTRPVAHPANCPSVLAVAAVDRALAVAPFSNRGAGAGGGQVDIGAPGVDVLSSWPSPVLYRRLSGTSMAAPHVAGVAALEAEARSRARGLELRSLLAGRARRLRAQRADIGAGLVQAP